MDKATVMQIATPFIDAAITAVAALLVLALSGLGKKAGAWLTAHHQSAAAAAVASATDVLNSTLNIGASTIVGKIQSGELDYSNKSALLAAVKHEETEAVSRMAPEIIALAAPAAGTIVANLMGMVQDKVVASPTLPLVTPDASIPTNQPSLKLS